MFHIFEFFSGLYMDRLGQNAPKNDSFSWKFVREIFLVVSIKLLNHHYSNLLLSLLKLKSSCVEDSFNRNTAFKPNCWNIQISLAGRQLPVQT